MSLCFFNLHLLWPYSPAFPAPLHGHCGYTGFTHIILDKFPLRGQLIGSLNSWVLKDRSWTSSGMGAETSFYLSHVAYVEGVLGTCHRRRWVGEDGSRESHHQDICKHWRQGRRMDWTSSPRRPRNVEGSGWASWGQNWKRFLEMKMERWPFRCEQKGDGQSSEKCGKQIRMMQDWCWETQASKTPIMITMTALYWVSVTCQIQ